MATTSAAPPIKGIFIFKNMGCDIHFHSEVKIKGKWHHHSQASVSRNYPLFAKMAGVRNEYDITPISEPKGVPEDATELTQMDVLRYGEDGHSHSWFDAKEIVLMEEFIRSEDNPKEWFGDRMMWYHYNLPYFMGNHFSSFVKYPKDWAAYEIEDIRFVFFFDN